MGIHHSKANHSPTTIRSNVDRAFRKSNDSFQDASTEPTTSEPPPYQTCSSKICSTLRSRSPPQRSSTSESSHDLTYLYNRRTPIYDCDALLQELKDLSMRLEGRNKAIEHSNCGTKAFGAVSFHAIGARIEKVASDAKDLEQEILKAVRMKSRIDPDSVPAIDKLDLWLFLARATRQLEEWLNDVEENVLEMDTSNEEARRKLENLGTKRVRLEKLCLIMSAKCSIQYSNLQKRKMLSLIDEVDSAIS